MQNALLPEDKLIKPNQVYNLGFLTPEQKAQYHEGVSGLWKRMGLPPEHPDRHNAYRRLSDISTKLKASMIKWKTENGQPIQGSQMRPAMPSQQDQAMALAQQQNAGQVAPQAEFSARVKQEAGNFQPAVPLDFRQRPPDEQRQLINNAKRQYAVLLQKYETAKLALDQFTATVQARRAERGLSQQETTMAQNRHRQHQNSVQEAQNSIVAFKRHHEQAKQQAQAQAHQQAQQAQIAANAQAQAQQQAAQAAAQQQQQQAQIAANTQVTVDQQQVQKQEPVDAEPSVPIKTEAESNDVPQVDAGTRPSTGVQDQKPLPTQTQQSQTHPTSTAPATQSARMAAPQTSPQAPPSGGNSTSAPHALTHQAAISRAASYNQSSAPGHSHPATQQQGQNIQREQPASTNSLNQRPPTRPLNVPPLTAVTMASARPTLAGGQGPVGQMGQPAIQTLPGYMLRGEGDRVLSKNKLQELVREVTGGAGGEGAETLDPEVEEASVYFTCNVYSY